MPIGRSLPRAQVPVAVVALDRLEAVRRLAPEAPPQIALRGPLPVFSESLFTISPTAMPTSIVRLLVPTLAATARLVT